MNRLWLPFLGFLLLLPPLPGVRASTPPKGVVVEEVEAGLAADLAGLQLGDVLLEWQRAATPPANPEPAVGELTSPFDLDLAEMEQAPRGELTLAATRRGEHLLVRLPLGNWGLRTRPRFTASQLVTYQQAKALIDSNENNAGLSLWRDMASMLADSGDHVRASWLYLRIADIIAESDGLPTGPEAFEQALDEAKTSGVTSVLSMVKDSWAAALFDRREYQRAFAADQEVLEIRQRDPTMKLGAARSLYHLGILAHMRGNLTVAEDYLKRGLTIREEHAPQSLQVAKNLNGLGNVAMDSGDLASAEGFLRRSLAIRQRLVPHSIDVAASLNNLGNVAQLRGDLETAEGFYRRSLTINQKLAPQSLNVAAGLNNLGNVAWRLGHLVSAEDFLRRSLSIQEKLAPQSHDVATSLANLGNVAFVREDFALAEDYVQRALAIYEQLAPRGIGTAEPLRRLGDIALARSDLSAAEAFYQRSLAIRRQRAPGSADEAESCQRLAALSYRRGNLDLALELYDEAIDALESQKSKLGGSDEVRSGFGAKVAGTYRQAIALSAEVGNMEKAFHLLERYRARELLAMLAGRDLVFSSDIPEQLEKRQQSANQSYDLAFERWMHQPAETGADEQRKARLDVETARRRQDEIRAAIRAASPRLAALQDPRPLDLDATRAALDPGTLLLSYSIGADRSHLFAVGTNLQVFNLAIGEESLRDEVQRFREVLGRGQVDRRVAKVLLHARRLSELLLAPAATLIGQAERLLILADGPIHSLPFAALVDPTAIDGRRFLIEAKPVHLAASATVFALLKQQRRERRPTRLTAFGDPRYPTAMPRAGEAAPHLQAALRSGLELTPLPATRLEVESLQKLHPQASQVFIGAEATEGRAKAVGQETTHLHIASHGLLDDRYPLDSALALSIPAHWQEGEDNGLLQAWEIFEQVRIDADLVTLSACSTGLGKVLGGEGLQGLTRAFQYAGARSVLASLWSVSDASTGELMERFYAYLKQGQSKAEALRSAQLDLVRDPALSHPFHWAGFELVGDWR